MRVVAFSEDSMRWLSALAGAVLGQDDLHSTLDEVVQLAVAALPACDGASLTTFEDGRPGVVAADGDWSRSLDELQYEEREGPCLDAARTGRCSASGTSLRTAGGRSTPLGLSSSALAAWSLPMSSEGKIVGALNVYSREPGRFSAEDVSLGELIATQAGVAMQVAASFFRHRDLAVQMQTALRSRARIEQAKGVLMGGRGCTEDEAFQLLVELSQNSNRKLREVAEALLESAQQGR